MPVYEYYCRSCETKFERLRPMTVAEQPAECPAGHPGAARTLSVFATFAKGADGASMPMGGGCACGGACACGGPSRN